MKNGLTILVGAGEIGGAKAIIPTLYELEKNNFKFTIIKHGFLADHAPTHWHSIILPDDNAEIQEIIRHRFSLYVFGSSLHDCYPLQIARIAKKCGLPVICVLDNWMNYKYRLEIDGKECFIPECYAVMDDLAKAEAVNTGIPEPIVSITGHPALAGLKNTYRNFMLQNDRSEVFKNIGLNPDKKLIVFISEPVENDQGADKLHPGYRGYTEKTVLKSIATSLQSFSKFIQVGVVPHPRENHNTLKKSWEKCRGILPGGLLKLETGRDAVFMADGVIGMASLLLFEAFLLGKPVISFQPGLQREDLFFLQKKGVKHFFIDEKIALPEIEKWADGIIASTMTEECHTELSLHDNAPVTLAKIIQNAAQSGGRKI